MCIHEKSHFGIEKTYYLCREKYGPEISKDLVKEYVRNFESCCKIDPAITFKWESGFFI